jgi:hypothetical protein
MEKFILASSTKKPPPDPASSRILPTGSPIDKFVDAISDKAINLTSRPQSNKESSADNDDPTVKWLQRIDDKSQLSLHFDANADLNVESFQVELTKPWPMRFSSSADDLNGTFGGQEGRITALGLDRDGIWLTCGLVTSAAVIKSTVLDLFEYAGITDGKDWLPSVLLPLAVTLDPAQGKGKRNAFWFRPSNSWQTVVRLQFSLDVKDSLQGLVGSVLKGFTIKSADVICKRNHILSNTTTGLKAFNNGRVLFALDCSIQAPSPNARKVELAAGCEISDSSITITLMLNNGDSEQEKQPADTNSDLTAAPLVGVLRWLGSLLSEDLEKYIKDLATKDSFLSRIHLRRVSVTLDLLQGRDKPRFSGVKADFEVSAKFGKPEPTTRPVVFLLSYTWNRIWGGAGGLRGQLWNGKSSSDTD